MPKVFTMENYINEFNKHTNTAKLGNFEENFTLSKFKFYNFCQQKGCIDTCKSEEVEFVKQ